MNFTVRSRVVHCVHDKMLNHHAWRDTVKDSDIKDRPFDKFR